MTIDQLEAYKRKAKAQRDNWKERALAIEAETVKRIADYAMERSGMFASDFAAKQFQEMLRAGHWRAKV